MAFRPWRLSELGETDSGARRRSSLLPMNMSNWSCLTSPPTVRAMVELQRVTGMRPGEVVVMTTGQIDRSGELWIYRPDRHKTVHIGREREIPLGPRAQGIVKPWLKADPDAPLFSPVESVEARNAERRKNRKTPKGPWARARRRKKNPKQPPRLWYDKNAYGRRSVEPALRPAFPSGVPTGSVTRSQPASGSALAWRLPRSSSVMPRPMSPRSMPRATGPWPKRLCERSADGQESRKGSKADICENLSELEHFTSGRFHSNRLAQCTREPFLVLNEGAKGFGGQGKAGSAIVPALHATLILQGWTPGARGNLPHSGGGNPRLASTDVAR